MKGLEFKISLNRKPKKTATIKNANDAASFLIKCFNKDTIEWYETIVVVCLNNSSDVLGWYKVAEGGAGHCVFQMKKLFQILLLSNATNFILAHNHPSGNLTASKDDKKTTDDILKASRILNINLFDHFIITKKGIKSILHDTV